MEDLLDDGPHLCYTRPGSDADASASSKEPERAQRESLNIERRSIEIPKDAGNPQRQHIFVLGAETSGTRFWTHLVGMGRHLTNDKFEGWLYDQDSAVFHISLPWGHRCQESGTVLEWLDFGGTAYDYSFTPDEPMQVTFPGGTSRLLIDIASTVQHHVERGDHVHVVLVVRNPLMSYAGKMMAHCRYEQVGVEEQREAFRLIKEARNLPQATLVCYEQMVEEGAPYMKQKLAEMGLDLPDLPEVYNGNDKYDVPTPTSCTDDMRAYIELCPNTADAESFRQV
eukprot:CAMPEP_0168505804 /NCGR_PEP_ID=MMETSP0228-20121227/77054_1 /TAXON_ID=133427 /ORGANISM="Protoceratium reticulatum, Strain CCCM 535 (=CCMP 1889)" /LENGTH=282 /DNA_ID=CAMNT_0008522891 /DNA_START=44 /DNA_END=892 /DNA_ORIENTATION=-